MGNNSPLDDDQNCPLLSAIKWFGSEVRNARGYGSLRHAGMMQKSPSAATGGRVAASRLISGEDREKTFALSGKSSPVDRAA